VTEIGQDGKSRSGVTIGQAQLGFQRDQDQQPLQSERFGEPLHQRPRAAARSTPGEPVLQSGPIQIPCPAMLAASAITSSA
jgi:hypothetical protein